jgi:hypothetical protein
MDSTPKAIFSSGFEAIHSKIFSSSLAAMSTTLRYDIYHLSHPGTAIGRVVRPSPDPLAPVRYACVYWVDHFVDALTDKHRSSNESIDTDGLQDSLRDGHTVYTFLSGKYLHWLEALSLARAVPEGVLAIERLHRLLQVYLHHSKTLHDIAYTNR